MVNTGHVHTGGHWLGGLGASPLGSFGCMRGTYAGACWHDLWEVGGGAEVMWILSAEGWAVVGIAGWLTKGQPLPHSVAPLTERTQS